MNLSDESSILSNLLFLFDIDGTLISTNGKAPELMISCVKEFTGKEVPYRLEDFAGRLDPMILTTLLERAGEPPKKIQFILPELLRYYKQQLANELNDSHITVFPGVIEFLEFCLSAEIPHLLLTGNMREGARIKLEKAGLWNYFPEGVFGDDASTRSALVPIAVERAFAVYRKTFSPDRIWIVGDSVHDIACARDNSCRCLIVRTGKTPDRLLEELQPDILVADFRNIEEIVTRVLWYYRS